MTFPFTDIPRRRHHLWLDLLCLAAVVAVIAAFALRPFFAGPGYGDESYQALCVRHWDRSPLAMYTFWKGHLWTSVFGDSYLSLRFLSCLTTMTAVALSCGYVGWRMRSWRAGAWLFVLCGSMGFLEPNLMYNWDVAPSILYVIWACASVEYWRGGRLWQLCLISAAVTLIILSRVQLIVAIPVEAFFVWLSARRHTGSQSWYGKPWAATAIAITVNIIVFLAVTAVMIGSPEKYFAAFVPDNIISGHSLQSLSRYISLPLYFLGEFVGHQILSVVGLSVGLWLSLGTTSRLKSIIGFVVPVAAGIMISLYFCESAGMDAGFNSAGMTLLLGFLLFIPAYHCMHPETEKEKDLGIILWLICIIYLMPTFGSDIYIMRLNACCLLPVVVYLIDWPSNKKFTRMLENTLSVSMSAFFTAMLVKVTLLPIYLPEKITDMPRLTGLRTTTYRLTDLKGMYQLYQIASEEYGSDRVTYYGDARYSFSYSFQESPIPYLHKFHTLDDESEQKLLKDLTGRYDAFIFCYVMSRDIAKVEPVFLTGGFRKVYADSSFNQGVQMPDVQMNVMYVRDTDETVPNTRRRICEYFGTQRAVR